MTDVEGALEWSASERSWLRRHAVKLGQTGVAIGLVLLWHASAVSLGDVFVAAPLDVFKRVAADTWSGELLRHVYVTLRLSAIGFALGCAAGVALPFILRRSPRLTGAVEPYIMMSVGVPKYALIPLFILWFGINDAPKLWLVGLLVFYVVFIAIFAGIRSVDRRLINMAKIAGASESRISREVVWNSLQPFFMAALKIALPRAVSAAIIGEFLVGNEGLGYLIENSRQQADTAGVFAGILVSTAIVLVINAVLVRIDRRANAWRPVERHMEL